MYKGFLRHTTSLLLAAAVTLVTIGTAGCGGGNAYQGLSAEELWIRAQQEFAEEDWGDAIDLLERLLTTYGEFQERGDARLLLADAYYNDEQYITANADYSRFLQRYGSHPEAPRAALGTCRALAALSPIPPRDQTYTEQAASACQNVVQDYTGVDDEVAAQAREIFNRMRSKLGEKAFENAEFYAGRDFWDSAIIYYEDVVERFADTRWAPRAILGIIEAYEAIGYEEEQEEWRQRLLDSYPDSPEARSVRSGEGVG